MFRLSLLVSAIVAIATLAAGSACAAPAAAGPRANRAQAAAPAEFHDWVRTFAQQALAEGIGYQTLQDVLGGVRWQPRVLELDRAQPELIRPPWVYLDHAVSAQRVASGREHLRTHASTLGAAARRWGVPSSVIVAIWGMESNYGDNLGSFRTVDVLATLAWEGRRREWARKELLAALRIIDRAEVAAHAMRGSWAGAMGQTQFLPSTFLAYAVDGDGDGRRDIWGSVPDVVASTANFLARAGWRAGEAWGVEVRVPPGFDWTLAQWNINQGSAAWAAAGVRSVDGSLLPAFQAASIVAPAGVHGPAFLVGGNFRALLRYNQSINYALAVGLLADQLEGKQGGQTAWPRHLQALTRSQVKRLQEALNARGFDAGTPDGVAGLATRAAVRRYQHSQGLVADGYATPELLQRLQGER